MTRSLNRWPNWGDLLGMHRARTHILPLDQESWKRILFDTGDDAAILSKNVKARRVDLTKLDFVVLSHRHSDHVSGLSYLLSVNPKVKIYAPKEGFGIFGSDLPSKFYRKDEALPAEMRYY